MTSVGTRPRHSYLPFLACAACGFALFQFLGNSTRGYIGSPSLFYWWGFQWVNPDSETQHGFMILAISLWLVWRNVRTAVREGEPVAAGYGWGALAMAAAILVHLLGFFVEQARVSIFGLLLFMWGLALFGGGKRWARSAAFPVAFMVFAIPLNALDSAGFWLRMWVVDTSAWIAHAIGIGVLVNGTQLLSADGRYDYDVAAACSGIRSLMALSALSLLLGYLRFRSFWIWVLMFAVSFPMIFVGNVFRIVSIVVAAQLGGQRWGDRIHEVMGFFVFAIVLGGVFSVAALVGRYWPAQERETQTPASGAGGRKGHAPRSAGHCGSPWPGVAVVVTASVLAAAALIHVEGRSASGRAGIVLTPDGLNPVSLPTFLGTDWIGRRSEVTGVERQVLPKDTGFSRKLYVLLTDPSKQAFLSIVLSGHDRSSIHRPELCLVAQGWTIRGSFSHSFVYPGASSFPATILRVEKKVMTPGGQVDVPQLFAYYFVGSDRVVASHWKRIAHDASDRLFKGESDRWAYVVVQTDDSDGEPKALERIQTILNGTLPVFQKPGLDSGKES